MTVPSYLLSAGGGDLVFFGGADASDAVHLVTGVVSNGIAVLTRSNLTHVAMVLEPSLPIGGRPQTSLNLIESTILAGKSGPQINPAEGRRLPDARNSPAGQTAALLPPGGEGRSVFRVSGARFPRRWVSRNPPACGLSPDTGRVGHVRAFGPIGRAPGHYSQFQLRMRYPVL